MAPEQRTERFNIRLAPVEVAMLDELADSIGVTGSDVIRMLIRERWAERFPERKQPRKKR